MADKYIYNNSGTPTEREGTVTSAGAGNAGDLVALDSAGKLDTTLMPTGIGAEVKIVATTENLSAGDWVNIYISSGIKARKADASGGEGKKAYGFVLAASTSPNNATVYVAGINNACSGLTAGTKYFLSGSTAGASTATAPTTSAYVVQEVGIALSDTEVAFNPQVVCVLA